MSDRPLRVLFLANDGTSVGHVTRALAVARALHRAAHARSLSVRLLLATTSRAHPLLAWAGIPCLNLPSPDLTSANAWQDDDRRQLIEHALEGVVRGFRPDVLVNDTFPAGPQLEAWSLLDAVPYRVLIRRTIADTRAQDPIACTGLDRYDRVLVPDDPVPVGQLPDDPRWERIRPIVLLTAAEQLPSASARQALALPAGSGTLITLGGGGDAGDPGLCWRLSDLLAAHTGPACIAWGALGGSPESCLPSPVPLQRFLSGFVRAFSACGYNTLHELAAAGIPAIYLPLPRTHDDQFARARRFETAGYGVLLPAVESEAVQQALARLAALPIARPPLCADGADQAAARILELIGSKAPRGCRR